MSLRNKEMAKTQKKKFNSKTCFASIRLDNLPLNVTLITFCGGF